jgi:hypothetical protein
LALLVLVQGKVHIPAVLFAGPVKINPSQLITIATVAVTSNFFAAIVDDLISGAKLSTGKRSFHFILVKGPYQLVFGKTNNIYSSLFFNTSIG